MKYSIDIFQLENSIDIAELEIKNALNILNNTNLRFFENEQTTVWSITDYVAWLQITYAGWFFVFEVVAVALAVAAVIAAVPVAVVTKCALC